MGATYTRQSSAGITDGAVIEASDLNDEFDQLLAAFVAASGHTHDGTAAEGGPVAKLLGTSLTLGDGSAGTDITVTFDGESNDGVLTWMEDEDLFKFSDAINVGVDDTGYDVKFFGDTASRYWLWDTSADGVVQRGTLTVGVDDTGHDVKYFGATSGKYWLWDESADGVVQIGALTVGVDDAGHDVKFFGDTASAYMLWDTSADDLVLAGAAGIDLAGDIDVDGTANLDIVDIDGAVQVDNTITVGADDQGYDIKFFGDTASAYMLWDTSADDLVLAGAAGIDLAGDIDVDGTANLDVVDIDGNVQIDGTVTVGVDDTGKDVKFFGASAGAYMEWDESVDQLRIMGASADATTSTGKLLLATSLTDINANDVIGKIEFQAPHEAGGTDAITVAASIQAIAQGTFSASVNATDLIFYTGHSEANTEKFRFTSQGEIGIGGANYGTDGQVLTSGGAGAAPAWEDATGGAALTGSTNNTVVTVTGSNTVQGEANFTYDSTDAALTSSTSNKPVFSFTNTNTDANGSILKFIKDAGEAGAANDISGLVSFYADDADQNNQEFGRITGRVVDATSGGEEGALDFYVAEYDGTVTKGMEIKGLASDGNITVDVSTHDGAAGGLMLAGTLVTSTATELNLMDGGTTAGTTAVASGDGIVTNDGGTMRQTTLATFDTYLSASTKTLTNKTLTAPKFADAGFIADASGNELIILQTTGTAVNQFDVANAATGNDPTITATGGDSNVGLGIVAKGTGVIQITSAMNPTITSTGKALVLGF
jgi:hypothetical protein